MITDDYNDRFDVRTAFVTNAGLPALETFLFCTDRPCHVGRKIWSDQMILR
jgi:hypothetical protein